MAEIYKFSNKIKKQDDENTIVLDKNKFNKFEIWEVNSTNTSKVCITQDSTIDYLGHYLLRYSELINIKNKTNILMCACNTDKSFILDNNLNKIETLKFLMDNGECVDNADGTITIDLSSYTNAVYIALSIFSDSYDIGFAMYNDKTKLSMQDKYRFLMTGFNNANNDMQLCVLGSNDLINFELTYKNIYKPSLGNQTLRDPSIVQLGDHYYITYTAIDWVTGHNIGMCRTKDFINYEELGQVDVGSQFVRVWAPEFFTNGFDTYIIFTASVNNDMDTFQSYYAKYNWLDNSIATATKFELGNYTNIIDTTLLNYENGVIAVTKNELVNYKNFIVFIADSINGTFTEVYNDYTNRVFGQMVEGCTLIRLDNGLFRLIYEDISIGWGNGELWYSDSADLINWSERKKINMSSTYAISHPYIIDFNKAYNTVKNNVLGQTLYSKQLSFSSNEIYTGKTWINGSKIYSKTLYVASITTINSTITAITDTNISNACTNHKFVGYKVYGYKENNVFLELGTYSDSQVKIWFNTQGEVKINTPVVLNDIYITIEYIK